MPGEPKYIDDSEWNTFVASMRPAPPPTGPTRDLSEESLKERLHGTGYYPFGLFAPKPPLVNGYRVGAASPATDSLFHFLSDAPPGAYAQGIRPQAVAAAEPPMAPSVEEARRNQGPAPAGGWPTFEDALGRTSNEMGSPYRLGVDDQEVRDQYRLYRSEIGGIPGIGRPDRRLTTLGTDTIISAADKKNAAIKAQSLIEAEQKKDLAGAATDAANVGEKAAIEEESYADSLAKKKQENTAKMEADRKWLEDNPTVDPYKPFRTNAGAGIMAALGAALMATGASLRRDSSLNWTQQIASMLDRETEMQARAIQNKRHNLNDQERALKQIIDSSNDDFEVRMRARNQKLFAINKRLEAIKAGSESKIVTERANELIAQNNEAMGKNLADVGIRQQGIDSQIEQARVGAATAGRATDVNLLTAILGSKGQESKVQAQARQAILAPKLAEDAELKKLYGRADTTLRMYFDTLRNPNIQPAGKNAAAKAFHGALQALMEGTDSGPRGDRPEIQAYGWPRSWEDVTAKFDRYDPQSLAEMRMMMRRLFNDRHAFIWGQAIDPNTTPGNSKYSQPPPGR